MGNSVRKWPKSCFQTGLRSDLRFRVTEQQFYLSAVQPAFYITALISQLRESIN